MLGSEAARRGKGRKRLSGRLRLQARPQGVNLRADRVTEGAPPMGRYFGKLGENERDVASRKLGRGDFGHLLVSPTAVPQRGSLQGDLGLPGASDLWL